MKRPPRIALLALALVLFAVPFGSAEGANETIRFADKAVEARVREILSIPQAPITANDMKRIDAFIDSRAHEEAGEALSDQTTRPPAEKIQTIEDLAYCTNLKSLFLMDESVSSLEPLRDLRSLEEAVFVDCPLITDVEPLAGLPALWSVVLVNTGVRDASPVLAMPGLRTFVAYGVPSDFSIAALLQTSGLEKCFLRKASVVSAFDYTPLMGHANLREVMLVDVAPSDFAALVESWPALEMLDVTDSQLTNDDLQALRGHSLTQLRLQFCPNITDLTSLAGMESLRSMILFECGIEDVSSIGQMAHLDQLLDLRGNPVQDIGPLGNLDSLDKLMLSPNEQYPLDMVRQLLPRTAIVYGNLSTVYEPLAQ